MFMSANAKLHLCTSLPVKMNPCRGEKKIAGKYLMRWHLSIKYLKKNTSQQ